MRLITIATDFGTVDGYVGEMKGVIKSISPSSEIIDITHDLYMILKTSLTIERYYSSFPHGTIHLVVVDPTVGSDRIPLIGYDGDYYFVGPDNGIFSKVKNGKWWRIDSEKVNKGTISSTFHGRDIFAPVAAMLSENIKPDTLGTVINNIVMLNYPDIIISEDSIKGEVSDIDNFGNLITNINSSNFKNVKFISIGDESKIPFVKIYSDVLINSPLAYIGSGGYLEIAVNCGRADKSLNANIGTEVSLKK